MSSCSIIKSVKSASSVFVMKGGKVQLLCIFVEQLFILFTFVSRGKKWGVVFERNENNVNNLIQQ